MISSNRGLAGGYNGNLARVATRTLQDAEAGGTRVLLEVSGKRGISYCKFRGIPIEASYTQFEDRPQFAEVEILADRYLGMFLRGEIDRLDVVYTRFLTASRQEAIAETLLPMSSVAGPEARKPGPARADAPPKSAPTAYEFLPDAASILEEIVPVSFKVRLFKAFLDAAVSEQIARMVAMKGATENADAMVKSLSQQYNRARQSQITRSLAEIIGGAAALE
ncbi:MAG: F0F1 ATP synthase subunit gamma [Isosphaeraceae bacterium]